MRVRFIFEKKIILRCMTLCLAGTLLAGCGPQEAESVKEEITLQETETSEPSGEQNDLSEDASSAQEQEDKAAGDTLTESKEEMTQEEADDAAVAEAFETLSKIEAYTESGTLLDSGTGQYELLMYSLEIPEVSLEGMSPEAAANVQYYFETEKWEYENEKTNSYREADNAYYFSFDQAELEQQEEWAPPVCSYEVHYDVTCNDEKYLSVLKHTYIYSGGAHGLYVYSSAVLDKTTGEKLVLDDFLSGKESDKAYLAEYVIEQFETAEMAEFFWDNYEEVVVNNICGAPVFFVDEGMLKFVFNQYELAAYVAGHQFAEIALTDLANIEEVVQNKERAQSFAERIKLPDEVNDYLVQIPMDKPVYADLDGNGVEEEILLPAEQPEYFDEIRLQINGTAFEFRVDDNVERNYIGLMDMNVGDGKYELACYAYGPSDDPTTTFFRYGDGGLHEIGKAATIMDKAAFDESAVYTLGDGYYHGSMVIYYPLETRQISASWHLDPDTDMVVFCEADYYYFTASGYYGGDVFPYNLLDSVLVYEQDSRDADYNTVEPGARIRDFTMTDGENWLYAIIESGNQVCEGWIYVEDFGVEVERDHFEDARTVIENLHQVG